MRRRIANGLILILAMACVEQACGLSESLREPKLFFPKGYPSERAGAIEEVLRSEQFRYVDGMTSYWPDHWPTTLVYEGGSEALSEFLAALNRIEEITVRLTFASDLSKETGSALRAGSWWVKYAHTEPDVITVRINLAAKELRNFELRLLKP